MDNKYLIMFLAFVVLPAVGCENSVLGPGKELCANGGFEQGTEPWQLKKGTSALDTGTAHSGKASLRCHAEKESDEAIAMQEIILDQKEPIPVAVSAWSKAENVKGPKGSHYSLWCDVEYQIDLRPGRVDDWLITPFDPQKKGWQQVKAVFTPKHPVKRIRYHVLFRKFYTGTVWFDDISMREVSEGRLSGNAADVPEINRRSLPAELRARLDGLGEKQGLIFARRHDERRERTGAVKLFVQGKPVPAQGSTAVGTFDLRRSLPGRSEMSPPYTTAAVLGLWEGRRIALETAGRPGERLSYAMLLPKGTGIARTTFENWNVTSDRIFLRSCEGRLLVGLKITRGDAPCRVSFHVRPEKGQERAGGKRPSTVVLATGDGLRLELGADGILWNLSVGAEKLGQTKPLNLPHGLLVGDGADGVLRLGKAAVEARNGAAVVTSSVPEQSLDWKAKYTALPDRISVEGEVHSGIAEDRAVDILFKLPLGTKDLVWWDDIVERRDIEPPQVYLVKGLTFGCVTRKDGKDGVGIGLSPDIPCVFEMGCNPSGVFYVRIKYALSPLTKSKQRAKFSFSIFRVDGRWGLRDAARHYYKAYPKAFERRATKEGMWLFAIPTQKVPNPKDYAYHECGVNYAEIDEKLGILTFPYIIPGQRSLTRLPKLPADYDEAMKTFEEFKQRPGDHWGDDLVGMIKHCRVMSADGTFPIRIRDDVGADVLPKNPINMIVFSVNCDPDLFADKDVSTVGKFELAKVRRLLKEHPLIDGIYIDSGSGWVSRYLNFRRDHFPYVDVPLTYNPASGMAAIDGRFCVYEFLKALGDILHPSGRLVFPNLGCTYRVPWHYYVCDVCGLEGRAVDLRSMRYFRTMAYHKPALRLDYIVLLGRERPLATREGLETYFERCTSLGIYPSIGRYCDKTYKKFPDLYKTYMPILRQLGAAGWEPVTHARCSADGVAVERFGPRGGKLFFTIYNETDKPVRAGIEIDLQSLGLKKVTSAGELVRGGSVPASPKIEIELPPEDLRVISLAVE